MPKLSEENVLKSLQDLPAWSRSGHEIQKKFAFQSFPLAIAFVNQVATVAEIMNHHPDITINYDQVGITLSTHSAGGLTQKDFRLAGEIEKIYRQSWPATGVGA
jgi:4a-hydroxytetrahydrobiopterin dehydratase